MKTKFIEASQASGAKGEVFRNWGKFLVGRFEPDEWERRSAVLKDDAARDSRLLSECGWGRGNIFVMDLQTGEGAFFRPGGSASADLNKHAIWVCPLYEPFLEWLYKQDLADLGKLPDRVDLPEAEFEMYGYRRPGPARECPHCLGKHVPDPPAAYVDFKGRRFRPPFRCLCCVLPGEVVSGHFKPIEDYRPSESCLGLDGHAGIERAYRHKYRGEVVRISAVGVLPFSVTPDHPILVVTRTRGARPRQTEPYFKGAGSLAPKLDGQEGDYLVIPAGGGKYTRRSVGLREFTNKRGWRVARHRGMPRSLPLNRETAWLLGLFAAEGWTSGEMVQFALGRHERGLAMRLRRVIRHLGYSPVTYKANTATRIILPSRLLSRAFRSWFGANALEKRVPEFLLYHVDRGIVRSFIAGYIAGDGYKRKARDRKNVEEVVGTTVSRILALQVQHLGIRVGLPVKVIRTMRNPTSEIQGRPIRQHDQYRVSWPRRYWLPGKPYQFRRSGRRGRRFIARVRKLERSQYDGEVFNLKTGSGTYLVNNAVVHNCGTETCGRQFAYGRTCARCDTGACQIGAKTDEEKIKKALREGRRTRSGRPPAIEIIYEPGHGRMDVFESAPEVPAEEENPEV